LKDNVASDSTHGKSMSFIRIWSHFRGQKIDVILLL